MNTKAVEPKTKLKIHVNKPLAIEPPELAGFYVDSVFKSWVVPRVDVALSRAFLNSQWRIDQAFPSNFVGLSPSASELFPATDGPQPKSRISESECVSLVIAERLILTNLFASA